MAAIIRFLYKYKSILTYGISLAFLLLLLKYLELRFLLFNHSIEIYIGFIAIIFTALGIWLALKLSKHNIKTVVIEKEVYPMKHLFKINRLFQNSR
jgi:two-component system, NarL family, response regulator LiaR